MEGKSTIEITMALGIQNENILFHRADADKPEAEKVIKLCYCLLQQEPSKIENIYKMIKGDCGKYGI